MNDKYTRAAIRIIEASHRNAYGRLLDIAVDPNNGAVMQLAATGEAIMLAAKLAKARASILRTTGQDNN